MPTIGQSAKLYFERRLPAMQKTHRGPGPQLYLTDNLVNYLKLEAPLPLPQYLAPPGPQNVDTTLTQVWPHGDATVI